MQNLVIFFIAMATIAISNSFSLNKDSVTMGCKSGETPKFTNESFCSSSNQKVFTCCHGKGNDFRVANTFLSELSRVSIRFEELERKLGWGTTIVETCLSNMTTLKTVTKQGLEKLSRIPWKRFLEKKSFECEYNVGKGFLCAGEQCLPSPLPAIPPCASYCTNILRGCYRTLSDNLQLPWKQAVNSVRTAIRLLGCNDELQATLGLYREPLLWLEEGACRGAPNNECFAGVYGEEGLPMATEYSKPTAPWSSKSVNPEFYNSEVSLEFEGELSVAKEELEIVSRSLTPFWPQASSSVAMELPQNTQSSEEYDDDEYLEASGSGSNFHDNTNFQTDDEDLLNEGSGNHDTNFYSTEKEIIIYEEDVRKETKTSSLGNRITITNFLFMLIYINF